MTDQEVDEPVAVGLPRTIARDDLVARLDRATARRVTVISAPAGSGKTSLLRAWAGRPGGTQRIAFVPMRRDEQDARLFWSTLLDAVRRASGTTSDAEPATVTPDVDLRTLADRVLAELADLGGRVMVVIDDLHELNSPAALAQLARLLANLPPNGHAILATRRDLQLGLHQLRLAGELAEIRAAELRFTESETRQLLAASGIALSEAGAARLHQRTEGWAAGLRLAALSLTGHPDPERFVTEFSGSDRTVAEYLLAEMLDCQPGDIQNLLLRTSLLDQVNGELADLLTGRAGSERILLELEDANAFVVSLDPERSWFRYHHLFADLLRLELRRRLPGQVPVLHRRAAGWFTRHGRVTDAIRHTQAAGDWPEAARLLADHSFSLTMDGQGQTVRALLQAFPQGTDYAELALVRVAHSLVRGRLDEAAAHLRVAEAHAETAAPDRRHRLRTAVASLKLALAARRGHLAGITEQARLLDIPVTGQSDEDIALGNDLRAVALMNLGTVEASLGLADAERHLTDGAALARKIGRPYLEVRCLAQLGLAPPIRPFATASRQQRCREAIALAERHGWGTEWIITPALLTLAGTLAWTGEFDEAEQWLHRSAQALRTGTGPDLWLLLHQVTGMLHTCRGRHQEALAEFSAAEQLAAQLAGPHVRASQVTGWLLATQARLGRTAEASAAIAALGDERASSGEIRNARAVISLAEGEPAGALGAVQPVLDGTAPVMGYVTVVEAQLLAAFAQRALGDQRAANQATESALALAEPDRLVLPFAITGAQELLEALPRHETAHAALLTDIIDTVRRSPASPAGHPLPSAPELSLGELRVLRYLPTNLSRAEIAGELSVSLNTVGTHIRRIYAKLGADDRSAAVQRARELRLLSADRMHGIPRRAPLLFLQAVGQDDLVDRRDGVPTPPVPLELAGERDPADRLPARLGHPLQAGAVGLG
jgi:LuxR family maltose regulon positive regulatory protein